MAENSNPNEEEPENDQPNQETEQQPTKTPKTSSNGLPLPSKFYVKSDDLIQFLYPAHSLHPNSTLRLFLFAEYGPLYNHHSYHQCLCLDCKQKCKSIRSQNATAKQLYFGKILIGTESLQIDDESLDWICPKCKLHCSTVHHLKSGPKNLHIVSNSELLQMEQEVTRNDLLSCFVSRKEQLSNPLSVEEEDELIGRQPMRVKYVPKLSKQNILDIFQKLPTYKMKAAVPEEPEIEVIPDVDADAVDGVEKPTEIENQDPPQNEEEENVDAVDESKVDEEVVAEQEEEEDEGEDVMSFYDISAVVRKVREERKKDLKRRSVTKQDPVRNGPPNRSKALNTWALQYTNSLKNHRLADCELSDVTTSLLHTFTHEITTLKDASNSGITQNVRLLRHLQKDNATNWDSNCCNRGSNRLTNHGK